MRKILPVMPVEDSRTSTPSTTPARVISSPSRIQAVPSAMISLLWNRVHGNRSSRAGDQAVHHRSAGISCESHLGSSLP
jgi:hypothetical protein